MIIKTNYKDIFSLDKARINELDPHINDVLEFWKSKKSYFWDIFNKKTIIALRILKKGKTAMNKDQLASVVASEVGLSQSDAKAAVDAVFDGITNGMKNGDKVSIAGFGQFESRYRAARQGRNPATGETIQIAAKNAPAFKAAKGLKDSLN